jgi:acyl carrier protein
MTKSQFYTALEKIIEAEPGTIQGHESLAELEGWDSLSVVQFIATMDKALGSAPPPSSVVSASTVSELLATVAEKLQED